MYRKKLLVLSTLLVLMFAFSPVVQATGLHSGVTFNAYVTLKTRSIEITIDDAEVSSYSEMFNENTGYHSTIGYSEGEAVNLNAIIGNSLGNKRTVEMTAFARYKPTGGDWTILWVETINGEVDLWSSRTGKTDTVNLKEYGWWALGTAFHVCVHIKEYPSSNPSDFVSKAFSMWFYIINDSTDTTPDDGTTDDGNGDSGNDTGDGTTTTDNGTEEQKTILEQIQDFIAWIVNTLKDLFNLQIFSFFGGR